MIGQDDHRSKLRVSGERISPEELARIYNFEPRSVQEQRERELIEDLDMALPSRSSSGGEFDSNLSLINVDGAVLINSDFTTGIIQLNRTIFNKEMNMEDRRKVLLGSDQIIP
jgi:hypothetical protein